SHSNIALGGATVILEKNNRQTVTDSTGYFVFTGLEEGVDKIRVTHAGYAAGEKAVIIKKNADTYYKIFLSLNDTLAEVVVTGVSRTTLIRENPLAIVAVSRRQIEQITAPNIIDVLARQVPGMNVVKTGPNVSKPFIRGLGYNRVLTLYN